MHGYFAVAGALATFFSLLGAGFGSGGGPVNDFLYGTGSGNDENFEAFGSETVVEGHTTYVVLQPGDQVDQVRPAPPMSKELQCEEFQPGFVTGGIPPGPVYERCYVSVGPIDPDEGNVVTDAYVDEVTATVSVDALEESKKIREDGFLAWASDNLPFI